MPTTKKLSAEYETAHAASALINTRAYLADVLKRVRALSDDVKKVSGDLAFHYRKHTRSHNTTMGHLVSLPEGPIDYDPAMAARLRTLQGAIGEFVHAVGIYS